MTAAQAGTRTTSEAGGPDRPQWVSMSRFFLGHALSTMLWTTGVTLVLAGIGALLGWQVEVIAEDWDSFILGLTMTETVPGACGCSSSWRASRSQRWSTRSC